MQLKNNKQTEANISTKRPQEWLYLLVILFLLFFLFFVCYFDFYCFVFFGFVFKYLVICLPSSDFGDYFLRPIIISSIPVE